jgi:hypothetical protein
MACRGEIRIDHAVFADTGNEPPAVYRHLEWCQTLGGPPIHVVRHADGRNLGEQLLTGNQRTKRSASIPAFLFREGAKREGIQRRQCSKEFKIEPLERFIRRELVGLKHRGRWPADELQLIKHYGISLDEAGRAWRIRANTKQAYVRCEFPLLDRFWSRKECVEYLSAWPVPHEVWKSACVFCPYHSDAEWRKIRDDDPASWAYAVELDRKLREAGSACNRAMVSELYLHRQCVPLDQVELDGDPLDQVELDGDPAQPGLPGFSNECMGVCGV